MCACHLEIDKQRPDRSLVRSFFSVAACFLYAVSEVFSELIFLPRAPSALKSYRREMGKINRFCLTHMSENIM